MCVAYKETGWCHEEIVWSSWFEVYGNSKLVLLWSDPKLISHYTKSFRKHLMNRNLITMEFSFELSIYYRTNIDIQSRAVIFPSITTTIILLNIELKTQMILLNYIFLLLYIPSRFNIHFVWLKMTNSPPLKVSLNWSLIGFDIQ